MGSGEEDVNQRVVWNDWVGAEIYREHVKHFPCIAT